jgi:hypothetical protein
LCEGGREKETDGWRILECVDGNGDGSSRNSGGDGDCGWNDAVEVCGNGEWGEGEDESKSEYEETKRCCDDGDGDDDVSRDHRDRDHDDHRHYRDDEGKDEGKDEEKDGGECNRLLSSSSNSKSHTVSSSQTTTQTTTQTLPRGIEKTSSGQYKTSILIKGKCILLGVYEDVNEASEVYENARRRFYRK